MASRSICSALLRTSVLSDVPHRRTTISSRSSCKRGCQRPEERRGEGRRPLRCFPVAGKRRKARARRALRGSWCEAAPPCALPSRKHANQDARAVCGVTIQPPATRSAREAPQFGARATPDHAPAKRRLLCQGRTLSFASSGLSSGASFSPLPFFPLVLLFLGGAGLSAGLPTAISPGASQERSTRLSGACPRAVRCERLSAACHTRRCRRHRRGWTGESAARHAAARCGAPNPHARRRWSAGCFLSCVSVQVVRLADPTAPPPAPRRRRQPPAGDSHAVLCGFTAVVLALTHLHPRAPEACDPGASCPARGSRRSKPLMMMSKREGIPCLPACTRRTGAHARALAARARAQEAAAETTPRGARPLRPPVARPPVRGRAT